MKNPHVNFGSEREAWIAFNETVEGLRLLRAFVKLSPQQRSEVIELVERFADDPEPVPDGVDGRAHPR